MTSSEPAPRRRQFTVAVLVAALALATFATVAFYLSQRSMFPELDRFDPEVLRYAGNMLEDSPDADQSAALFPGMGDMDYEMLLYGFKQDFGELKPTVLQQFPKSANWQDVSGNYGASDGQLMYLMKGGMPALGSGASFPEMEIVSVTTRERAVADLKSGPKKVRLPKGNTILMYVRITKNLKAKVRDAVKPKTP